MDEYISREAVFDEIRFQRELAESDGEASVVDTCDAMLHNLKEIKAADVQPVKHGYWKSRLSTPDSMKCSVCGNLSIMWERYCPHCSARMDGENK